MNYLRIARHAFLAFSLSLSCAIVTVSPVFGMHNIEGSFNQLVYTVANKPSMGANISIGSLINVLKEGCPSDFDFSSYVEEMTDHVTGHTVFLAKKSGSTDENTLSNFAKKLDEIHSFLCAKYLSRADASGVAKIDNALYALKLAIEELNKTLARAEQNNTKREDEDDEAKNQAFISLQHKEPILSSVAKRSDEQQQRAIIAPSDTLIVEKLVEKKKSSSCAGGAVAMALIALASSVIGGFWYLK